MFVRAELRAIDIHVVFIQVQFPQQSSSHLDAYNVNPIKSPFATKTNVL